MNITTEILFLKNYTGNEEGRLVPNLFLFTFNLAYNKRNCKTFDFWFRDMLILNCSEKDLGLVPPPYFVYDFFEKSFWGEIKSIFDHFKGLSVAKNCLSPDSVLLRMKRAFNMK